MKIKKKGKVHPSQASSSSPTFPYKDTNFVFKLLPVTILALASTLPPQDRDVLAYMITRSIVATLNPFSLVYQQKNRCKKGKVPVFKCGCFDCYTSFWHRWDSSPNRDLIHQVIEGFEDCLLQDEASAKPSGGNKKKEKAMGLCEVLVNGLHKETQESKISAPGSKVITAAESESEDRVEEEEKEENMNDETVKGNPVLEVVIVQAPGSNHKGLARNVLPDLVGLFNSRLWNLWGPSPNV